MISSVLGKIVATSDVRHNGPFRVPEARVITLAEGLSKKATAAFLSQ
jgi:hypothetical protein